MESAKLTRSADGNNAKVPSGRGFCALTLLLWILIPLFAENAGAPQNRRPTADARRRAQAGARSGEYAAVVPSRETTRVPLSRIAWLVTVGLCLIGALLLVISGYLGYAGVVFAVALSAAINLR
jgi:hypothetical protein